MSQIWVNMKNLVTIIFCDMKRSRFSQERIGSDRKGWVVSIYAGHCCCQQEWPPPHIEQLRPGLAITRDHTPGFPRRHPSAHNTHYAHNTGKLTHTSAQVNTYMCTHVPFSKIKTHTLWPKNTNIQNFKMQQKSVSLLILGFPEHLELINFKNDPLHTQCLVPCLHTVHCAVCNVHFAVVSTGFQCKWYLRRRW